MALHAATLAALEAIVFGLAVCDRERALRSLERLNDLRAEVSGDPESVRRLPSSDAISTGNR